MRRAVGTMQGVLDACMRRSLQAPAERQQVMLSSHCLPVAAMGMLLIERLRAAGMTFQVLEAAGSAATS